MGSVSALTLINMCIPDWLPELVLLNDYSGDWESYLEALYKCYCDEFRDRDEVSIQGKRIGLRKHPQSYNKDYTFWHLIQEGSVEDDRTPDFRRCERIRWPMAVIKNSDSDQVKVWRNKRGNRERICLFVEGARYLVVLDDRGDYVLPLTAYPVSKEHRVRKLLREYEDYKKKQP